ncbi:hypothetical protein CHGG_09146 [Chaetomium globosum CBS 148.51]|uniref:Transcription factor PAP1 domain-containing protein n=1 Tax=Chaetomium globosum (strain ATCC 6205 / CBS 148.51 / DSM 1962 / NBRC 6347 / NRRL 1970) TaxID=306901 RepID=Q2GSA8_CHAGB|nr:uncharacterized protein CHGG_09146 [Chaetomium globosum CBS 148.51]EAQ85132.1 hypothetical protein CHGG_09146 [Chaetomium globosum CBS 148.51]
MTSSQNPLQGLVLTPQQQSLLFAALNSNRPSDAAQPTNGFNMSPVRFNGSPIQADGLSSFQNSPDLDYEYDFAGADSSFDYYDDAGQAKMIGDLPGAKRALKSESGDAESPEKRSHPDDEEEEGPGAKRRDSEEKMAKKPGRKTSHYRTDLAQNRSSAAGVSGSAKRKHLKDSRNTKSRKLEKLSEDANNEKEALRAQVDKMTVELNEYKKRLSMLSGGRHHPARPCLEPLAGSADHRSPSEHSQNGVSPGDSSSYSQVGLDSQSKQDLAALSSGLFTPPLNNGQGTNGSSVSLDSHYNMGGPTTTSSPSASSNSNMGGPNSSCGTSPESFAQSPMGFKPLDTLSLGHFANTGIEDFTQWLPQNDFQFDPELFGGYRDPQENVLSQGFDEGFFNDAVDMDFLTPYNLPIPSPVPPKKDLISQIDAAKDADESTADLVLKCNEVWEKIQNCPKAKGGDFDLDGLCADLQKKAKCDGTGPVVSEKDFQYAIKKYICKEKQEAANIDAYAKTQAQS